MCHLSELTSAGRLATATVSALTLSVLAASGQTAASTTASTPTISNGFQKPAWLQELSLGVKESYDNNVLLSDVGPTRRQGSMITTVSPRIGFNLAPVIAKDGPFSALAFGYAPDFSIYHDEPTESNEAHRTSQVIKGKADAFSFSLENGFNYIDGSTEGPIYPKGRSGIATGAPRERREQFQDRGKVNFQYDQEKWFVRPTASVLYYDLMTDWRTTAGYDNYADRYDVNGGADFGYKLQPNLAVTLGYRYGHQYQQQYPEEIEPKLLSSSSDYQRVLVGLEGKPWKWLTVALQGGPDFRHYEPDSATHVTPVSDHDPIKYYGEASLTADVSARDAIGFKYRQWQWVSSTGRIPCFDSSFDLNWRHKFGSALTTELGGKILSLDYTSGNASSSLRDDRQFSIYAGVSYAFTSHLSGSLAYNFDLGRNGQDLPESVDLRRSEYVHHVISLGLQYKF